MSLDTRFRYHTGELIYLNRPTSRNSRLYTHYDKIGWNNVKISPLESIICNSFRQLHICETKHILPHLGSPNCLNMKVPFTYYNYRISKCTVLNSSLSEIYLKYIHAYKLDQVLREYMKLVKIYPTDYIYGRSRYIFSVVLEQLMRFVDYIPPTCSAESTALPLLSHSIQKPPKKRGRPRKHPLPDPLIPQTPKKRGRPRKIPPPELTLSPPKTKKPIQVKVVPPLPEPTLSPPIQFSRPKFSKKLSKINNDSLITLTSFSNFCFNSL